MDWSPGTQLPLSDHTAVAAAVGAGGPAGGQSRRVWGQRDGRMAALLSLITLVSVADLVLTLTFLRTIGMSEGNPIARWVISANCSWVLVVFKMGLVTFTCGVLWWARNTRAAEIGAWLGCLVMAWLCFRWAGYTQQVAEVVMATPEITESSTWVQFD